MDWKDYVIIAILSFAAFQIIFAVFIAPYFKKKKNEKLENEQKKLISTIKAGHEVLLTSGIYGKVIANNKDTLIIEIAPNTNIKVSSESILGFFENK